MRIMSNRSYDAICDIVIELQKENEKLKSTIAKKNEMIDYLNNKICARNAEISLLRNKLNVNGITWSRTGVDFPATTKDQLSSIYGKTDSIDFPATTKVGPENKIN